MAYVRGPREGLMRKTSLNAPEKCKYSARQSHPPGKRAPSVVPSLFGPDPSWCPPGEQSPPSEGCPPVAAAPSLAAIAELSILDSQGPTSAALEQFCWGLGKSRRVEDRHQQGQEP